MRMKFTKTEAGQAAFKARSPALTPRQRSAFILFDGKKSDQEVLAMTSGLGVTPADIEQMVQEGFLVAVASASVRTASATAPGGLEAQADEPGEGAAAAGPALSPQERYARAWPIATQITASLGLRGFRLNLAVEAAKGYEDLRDLLPKIREAAGAERTKPLEQALRER